LGATHLKLSISGAEISYLVPSVLSLLSMQKIEHNHHQLVQSKYSLCNIIPDPRPYSLPSLMIGKYGPKPDSHWSASGGCLSKWPYIKIVLKHVSDLNCLQTYWSVLQSFDAGMLM
jgi:hypothetical protein